MQPTSFTNRRAFVLLLVFFIGSICTYAQLKYEKEERIKANQVPQTALEFLEPVSLDGKVKWYKEYALEGTSVEAKTKQHQRWYSIEFSDQGVLEDIEIKVKFESLPKNIQQSITDYFSSTFSKYRIQKTQIQYTGEPSLMQNLVQTSSPDSKLNVAYELVLKGRKEGKIHRWECLFDDSGALVQQSQIVTRNTDNLEF